MAALIEQFTCRLSLNRNSVTLSQTETCGDWKPYIIRWRALWSVSLGQHKDLTASLLLASQYLFTSHVLLNQFLLQFWWIAKQFSAFYFFIDSANKGKQILSFNAVSWSEAKTRQSIRVTSSNEYKELKDRSYQFFSSQWQYITFFFFCYYYLLVVICICIVCPNFW